MLWISPHDIGHKEEICGNLCFLGTLKTHDSGYYYRSLVVLQSTNRYKLRHWLVNSKRSHSSPITTHFDQEKIGVSSPIQSLAGLNHECGKPSAINLPFADGSYQSYP